MLVQLKVMLVPQQILDNTESNKSFELFMVSTPNLQARSDIIRTVIQYNDKRTQVGVNLVQCPPPLDPAP
jgi:hypothetical protein